MPESGRGFAEGTRILTARGELPVERLVAGDLVLTLSGLGVPLKPVRRVAPVEAEGEALRLRPGALAAGMPIRDLVVGPAQPLRVEGVLIAAGSLANGLSILPEPAARRWIVALDRPDVIVANGAPAAAWPDAPEAEPQDPAHLAAIRAALAARAAPASPPRHPAEALLDRAIVASDGAGSAAADLAGGAAPPPGLRDG